MRVYTDASTDGSYAGLGWCCEPTVESTQPVSRQLPIVGEHTSMSVEWYALCRGAICANDLGANIAYIHSDCTPLIEKMRWQDDDGIWATRYELFNDLLRRNFDAYTFVDFDRSNNAEADRLAKEALYRAREFDS